MYHNSKMGDGDRYFNPKYHVLHEDGLLTIKASGYEDDSEHWTGHMTLSPSEADYRFWYWMACIRQVPELVWERDLAAWKEEYARSQSTSKEVVSAR